MVDRSSLSLLLPVGRRLTIALVAGIAIGTAIGFVSHDPTSGALGAITVTGALFVAGGWLVLWPMDSTATRENVGREDFRPVVRELVMVVAAVAALGAIVGLLVDGGNGAGVLPAVLAFACVFASWACLHLMYAARYAYLYFDADDDTPGGIDFNSDEVPAYRDFFYFSYNLGMTYQVSDTSVSDRRIRSVALRHCLLSYLFGAVILATTINLVAGVITR